MSAKLKAVNQMLGAILEDSVSSLDGSVPEAAAAEAVLDEVSEDVQEYGWHCNTDTEITLSPNSDGHILVAETILKIDTDGSDEGWDVTVRVDENDGVRKLWDKDNNTFVFDGDVIVTRVHYFEFENLTRALQRYIAARAAAEFQARESGSISLDKFLKRRMDEAWATLLDEEAETEDANMIYDSPSSFYIARRNGGTLWGG